MIEIKNLSVLLLILAIFVIMVMFILFFSITSKENKTNKKYNPHPLGDDISPPPPWMQGTIEPDINRRPVEIGGGY